MIDVFGLRRGAAWLGAVALMLALPAGVAMAQLTDADVEQIPAGDQPIKFSHQVHATDIQIPCEYCHIYARRSQVSGAPPVQLCMGCHQYVGTQLAEVQKLRGYWERKEPIPWVKIHDIPDFVRYPHFRHVRAKNEVFPEGIPCQTCHGPVETMHVVEKVNPRFGEMGWCLECHLQLPGSEARMVAEPAGPDSTALKDAMSPRGHHRPNLTDCLTCHK